MNGCGSGESPWGAEGARRFSRKALISQAKGQSGCRCDDLMVVCCFQSRTLYGFGFFVCRADKSEEEYKKWNNLHSWYA